MQAVKAREREENVHGDPHAERSYSSTIAGWEAGTWHEGEVLGKHGDVEFQWHVMMVVVAEELLDSLQLLGLTGSPVTHK